MGDSQNVVIECNSNAGRSDLLLEQGHRPRGSEEFGSGRRKKNRLEGERDLAGRNWGGGKSECGSEIARRRGEHEGGEHVEEEGKERMMVKPVAEPSPVLSSGRRPFHEGYHRSHLFYVLFGFVFGFILVGLYHGLDGNASYFSTLSNKIDSGSSYKDHGDQEQQAIHAVTRACKSNLNFFKKTANWTWIPKPNRYLVAMCMEGQYSNRIRCFSHSAVAASALNRTLIVPMEDLNNFTSHPYNYGLSLDVNHARHCLGNSSVLTVEEYLKSTKSSKLRIQKLFCFLRTCEFIPKNKWRTLSLPSDGDIVHFGAKDFATISYSEVKWNEFIKAFSDVNEEVISLGDLFFVQVGGVSWIEDVSLPTSNINTNNCRLIFKPQNAILKAAKGYVREFVGPDFAALHLRRSDFYRDKPMRRRHMFPIQHVAKWLARKLTELQLRVLFLATDASRSELQLLHSLLRSFSPPSHSITITRLPSMVGEVWAQDLNAMNLASDPTAIAMVDKMVCSMSKTFFSSRGSTFSTYIHHVRESLNISSCDDQFVCKGAFWKEFVPDAFSDL